MNEKFEAVLRGILHDIFSWATYSDISVMAIGSWGDTLPDEDVYADMDEMVKYYATQLKNEEFLYRSWLRNLIENYSVKIKDATRDMFALNFPNRSKELRALAAWNRPHPPYGQIIRIMSDFLTEFLDKRGKAAFKWESDKKVLEEYKRTHQHRLAYLNEIL